MTIEKLEAKSNAKMRKIEGPKNEGQEMRILWTCILKSSANISPLTF